MTRVHRSAAVCAALVLSFGCGASPASPPAPREAAPRPIEATPQVLPPPARVYEALGPPVAVERSLPEQVHRVVPSPDGVLGVVLGAFGVSALGSATLAPRIIDFDRDEVVGTVRRHRHTPTEARFFMDGKYLVTVADEIVVTDATSGATVRLLDGFDRYLLSDRGDRAPAAFVVKESLDRNVGEVVVREAQVVDLLTGEAFVVPNVKEVEVAAVSPTDDVVVITERKRVYAVRRDGAVLFDKQSDVFDPRPITFSPDGRLVAVARGDHFDILAVATGDPVETSPGPPSWHRTRAEYLASKGDKLVWSSPSAKQRTEVDLVGIVEARFELGTGAHVVLDKEGNVMSRRDPKSAFQKVASIDPRRRDCRLAFELDVLSRVVCVDAEGGRAASILLASGQENLAVISDDGSIPSVQTVDEDPSRFLFTCRERSVRFDGTTARDLGTNRPDTSVLHHDSKSGVTYETTVPPRANELRVLTKLDADGRVLWSLQGLEPFDVLVPHRSLPLLGLVRTANGSVEILDATNGASTRTFELASGRTQLYSMTFHPKKPVMFVVVSPATAVGGSEVRVFDVRRGEKLASLGEAREVELSADGSRILTSQPEVTLWDGASYTMIRAIPKSQFASCAFAFDDTQAALMHGYERPLMDYDEQKGIRFVDARTGKQRDELSTPRLRVQTFVSTRAGPRIFGVTAPDPEGHVQALDVEVWDVKTGSVAATLEPEASYGAISVYERGRFVSTSAEGRVRVLRPSDGAKIFVHAVEGVGSCEPVVVDPAGRFEGDPVAAASVVRYRLGNDLRRAKMVKPGDPEAASMRVTGALAAFLAAP